MIVWIREEDRRYYQAGIRQDLTGQWGLLRSWGSLDSNLGGQEFDLCETREEAVERLIECAMVRRRHKYRIARANCLEV